MTSPTKFAHIVYNTHRYAEMIDWYTRVFEARIQHSDDRLTFMTYDDEHHRFAFANLGPLPRSLHRHGWAAAQASTTSPTHGASWASPSTSTNG